MYEELIEELRKDGYTDKEIEELLSYDISDYIKDEVYKEKERLTDFMDAVKLLTFSYLLNKIEQKKFDNILDKEYSKLKKSISRYNEKGMKSVSYLIKKDLDTNYIKKDKTMLKTQLNDLLKQFEIDFKGSKTANDRYIKIIKDYYKKTSKTLGKSYIQEKEYLSKKVSKFDKVEKTVLYKHKNGTKFAYFDIASYDSMVYNTNLARTGIQETIKTAYDFGEDVVYIDPHPYSCPLCQEFQGRFYSLTGQTKYYNGYFINSLDASYYWSGGGLFHPNCTHIPRLAYEEDKESNEYSSEEWTERYNAKQKKQSLELKKKRLLNDNKIYKKLDNQKEIDKNKQKIKKLNKQIKEQKNLMNG